MTRPADAYSPRDLEEALAVDTRTLAYHPRTRRIRAGPERGVHVDDAETLLARCLRRTYGACRVEHVTLRPWWRLWQPTPALRLTPVYQRGPR